MQHGLSRLGLSDATRAAYTGDLKLYLRHLHLAGITPQEATVSDVENFVRCLLDGQLDGRPRDHKSANRALAAVRTAYREVCLRVPGWQHNPARDLRGFKIDRKPEPRARRPEEVRRMLSAWTPQEVEAHAQTGTAPPSLLRDQAMILLMATAGLRREEVATLRVPDSLLSLGDHLGLRFVRKGGKDGQAGLGALASQVLLAWLQHRGAAAGFLFPGAGASGQLALSSINRAVRLRSDLAGLDPHATPHDLRHTFVTQALDAGVPLQKVQYAADHADPRTTELYDRQRVMLQADVTRAVEGALFGRGEFT